MSRFIFIERNSGFIWGDIRGSDDPAQAATYLDQIVDPSEVHAYAETNRHDARAVYDVYRASESFPVVTDGQDEDLIQAVVRECRYVTTLASTGERHQ